MKTSTKITLLNDNDEKFFGEGPYRLLRLIEEYGSLRSAALSMDMSYSKAFTIMKNAEKTLGFPLTVRSIGGSNGGGSKLTEEANAWLVRYEKYRDECRSINEKLFLKYFPDFQIGCVIMASGLGKRFGGNKLMAELYDQPLIGTVLEKIKKEFRYSVVVTRSEEVSEYAKEKGFQTVLHSLPGRNDTVRLGISAMPGFIQGCVFFQADQPFLKTGTIQKLLQKASDNPEFIIRCICEGNVSSPVYFPRWAFEELCSLPEGKGGSALFPKYLDRILDLEVTDPLELKDIDTKEDLINANRKNKE